MTKPKAVAFDLDGTLAESKQRLSAEMGELLACLTRAMPVAVISGASFEQFQTQFFTSIPESARLENLYMFPENAGQCFVFRDSAWKPQYDHSFTDSEKTEILEALQKGLKETGLDEKPKELWGEQTEDRGAQISFSPLGQQAPIGAKEAWHSEHDQLRKHLVAVLSGLLPNFAIAAGGLTTIDITHKGITKAYGIHRFSELSGVAVPEILYVGDALDEGGNDSAVFETGVPTHEVFGPEETEAFIEAILQKAH